MAFTVSNEFTAGNKMIADDIDQNFTDIEGELSAFPTNGTLKADAVSLTTHIKDGIITTAKLHDDTVVTKAKGIINNPTSDSMLTTSYAVADYVDTVAKTGGVVQIVYDQTQTKHYSAAVTKITSDNTKPQITEGYEILSESLTPTSGNLLKIDTTVFFSVNDSKQAIAIFKDSDTDAIATGFFEVTSGSVTGKTLTYYVTATAGSQEYSIRVGGGGTIVNINCDTNNSSHYGDTICSTLSITEIKV